MTPVAGSALARLGARLRHPERIQQFVALGIRVLSAGIGYAILAAAARVTALADFSDFALVMAATAMFGAIATLGQETMLLRRLPLVCADGHIGYRQLLRRSGTIVMVGLAGFAIAAMLYGHHSFSSRDPLLLPLTGSLVMLSGAAELLFSIQRGSGSVLGAVFRRELVWKIILLGVIATLFVLHRKVGVTTLAFWYLVGTAAAVTLSVAFVAGVWRRAPAAGIAARTGPRDNAFAFFLLNFIAQAGTQLDVLVLGAMTAVPPVQLGACFAALRTIQVLYILPYGASITSAPRVPLAFAQGDTAEIKRLSRQISREVAGVVLVLTVLAFVFRVQILGSFRPEFAPYALLLPLLALGPLASAMGGLHNIVAPMCGMERAYSRWRLGIILAFFAAKLAVAKFAAASPHLLMLFAGCGVSEAITVVVVGVMMARRKLGVWIV